MLKKFSLYMKIFLASHLGTLKLKSLLSSIQALPETTKIIWEMQDDLKRIHDAIEPRSPTLTQSGNYGPVAKKRSVVFISNSYYHFYYLAQALRRRNWDVVTVSLEDPSSGSSAFYHGEDINLFDSDPIKAKKKQLSFFKAAKEKFDLLHVGNDFYLSFFAESGTLTDAKDIIEWRAMGKKIAYTVSGCISATKPSSVDKWSRMGKSGNSVCDSCVWQHNELVCSDTKSMEWIRRVEKYIDLTFAELLPRLDHIAGERVIAEPVTTCLDSLVWHPELTIPNEYIIPKSNNVLVYHSVGNYDSRTADLGKNIKGTPAILSAIERLKSEGFKVQLIFIKNNTPNREIRYLQAQADIIIDQLNYGRYGATAREGMMLGKPVVSCTNKEEFLPHLKSNVLDECPVVSSSELEVYNTLKKLIQEPELRLRIGKESRAFALKWHSADACAERYENIYDQLMSGAIAKHPEYWSYHENSKINCSYKEKILDNEKTKIEEMA
jgi:glycosyltransferase involved in cell wall biosynthesis